MRAHGCRCRARAGHPKGPEPALPSLPSLPARAARAQSPWHQAGPVEPRARCRQDRPETTAREGTDTGIMNESQASTEQLGCVRAEGQHGTGVAEPCGTLGTLGEQGTQAGGLSCRNWGPLLPCSISRLRPLLPSADSLSLSALHYDQSALSAQGFYSVTLESLSSAASRPMPRKI